VTPYYSDAWLTVYQGDCRAVMAAMEPESVHCVVTSPPYWGLRDYGDAGQLGLEPTPELYVAAMVEVFSAVRRVLRADGTVWLNLGDAYAHPTSGGGGAVDVRTDGRKTTPGDQVRGRLGGANTMALGLKPKDLVGIPWRVAFALQADGWYLRSDIIWAKPNPMPESVTDRPTKAHEYLFLLSKRSRYFYDAEAVAQGSIRAGDIPGGGGGYKGDGVNDAHIRAGMAAAALRPVATTRNLRSVWTIATQPYPGAHFATFPEALVEPCIKAGSPEGGTVLDPFGGSGTTARVANRLSRRAILIDLSTDYLDQAMVRNAQSPMGLAQ
jgi:DNA modification methylase